MKTLGKHHQLEGPRVHLLKHKDQEQGLPKTRKRLELHQSKIKLRKRLMMMKKKKKRVRMRLMITRLMIQM